MARPALLEGEVLLLITRRHWIALLLPLSGLTLAASFLMVADCPIAFALHLDGECPVVVGVAYTVSAGVLLLEWGSTEVVLTNQRLLMRERPLWRRSQALFLTAIEEVGLRQGALGRLLDFGTVAVDVPLARGGRLTLVAMPDPEHLAREISAAVLAARRRSA